MPRYLPLDTGRKLNVHKTFRRYPGRLPNLFYTVSLCPLSRGLIYWVILYRDCTSNLFKKETPTQVFSCEIYESFKNTYFEDHLRTAVSRLLSTLMLALCAFVIHLITKISLILPPNFLTQQMHDLLWMFMRCLCDVSDVGCHYFSCTLYLSCMSLSNKYSNSIWEWKELKPNYSTWPT